MILKNASFEEFEKKIKSKGKKVIVYGSGMIGQILAPYIFNTYNLDQYVDCYVDQDVRKLGTIVDLYTKQVRIESLNKLTDTKSDYVLIITNSHFFSIIEQLDNITQLNDIEAYILPIMQLTSKNSSVNEHVVHISQEPLIPKVIHYCWFSGNPMPDKLQKCLSSWKKYCPDYEIIRWDENNYDVNKTFYTKQAYENKKWGFIPDIARLEILYKYGGIYLDTDVELIRNLDDLLYVPGFCGVEKWATVNFGGCSASIKGNPVIKDILDKRIFEPFQYEDGTLNLKTCGIYETLPLIERGFKANDKTQIIDSLVVYSSDFFHPADYISGQVKITDNTFSIHHFDGGWIDEANLQERKATQEKYCNILQRMEMIL